MKIPDAIALLLRLTLPPKVRIEMEDSRCFQTRLRALRVRMILDTLDADDGRSRFATTRIFVIGETELDDMDEDTFLRARLLVELDTLMLHENREWFRLDGEHVQTPHPESVSR